MSTTSLEAPKMLAAVGQPVPDTAHAVSVSLPTWKANVGYEEGEQWVMSKMRTGYPRFFIHLTIQELERTILKRYGESDEKVMLFPSRATARRCKQFFRDKKPELSREQVHLRSFTPKLARSTDQDAQTSVSGLHCCFFPAADFPIAKQVWQHTGDGISSRRAEFLLQALKDGLLVPQGSPTRPKPSGDSLYTKGPRRYQQGGSQNGIAHHMTNGHTEIVEDTPTDHPVQESSQFVEERFGRNLNVKLAAKAKLAVRRRISGCLTSDAELDEALANSPDCTSNNCQRVQGMTENDIYLFPTGMSAIFNTHRLLLAQSQARGVPASQNKSICFGFPYIDTLKVLEKWGPGALFYGNGDSADLDDLEHRLFSGERYLALFTEFPSNPLLRTPDILRLRDLATKYSFTLVVDETVGNFINVDVLSHADVVVSSLTKVFSGDSNVMGGSMVLNPQSTFYSSLKTSLSHSPPDSQDDNDNNAPPDLGYEDNYWAVDAVFMERNSRDFIPRIHRVNTNASAIANLLYSATTTPGTDTEPGTTPVKSVYYPFLLPSRPHYDQARNKPSGGYSGLLSVTFHTTAQAIAFFDALEMQKGPSLGTNFSLSCPFVILAHYGELEWANRYGVETDLVRISVGLEEKGELVRVVRRALEAAGRAG